MRYQIPVLKHWLRLLVKQWFRSCLCFTFMCLILTYSLWLYNRVSVKEIKVQPRNVVDTVSEGKVFYVDYTKSDEVLGYAVSQVTQLNTCPVCLGRSFCSTLVKNEMNLQGIVSAQKNTGLAKETETWIPYATSESRRLEIGLAAEQNWLKFEEFICRNSSQVSGCKISSAARKTVLAKEGFFSVNNMVNLHLAVNKMRSEFPLLVCSTEKLRLKIIKAFDEDGDGRLNEEEQLIMLTSLIVQPSYALMKLRSSGGLSLPVPEVVGGCGRVVVRKADWTPLTESLKEPFEVRAGLALQVLQTIEDFQEEDSEWYILNTEFSYESLMVTKDGEVVLTNLQDVALVDKSLFGPRLPNLLDPDGDLCNEVCFQKFTHEILEGSNVSSGVCSRIPQYGQLMYALACKQLLSDLEEHRAEGFFNFDGNRVHKKPEHPGLLHSIPERDKESLEDLLRECVQETSSGGRKQAIEELREILEKYLNYEDDDEDTNNMDEQDSQ